VVDVWKGLLRHNFLSVPVLQQTKQKFYGSIDVADIVQFFVDNFGSSQLKGVDDYWKLIEREEHFNTRKVRDIMKYPINRRNPFHPLKMDYSLWTAVEALAREPTLHRVPIIDENRSLLGLITQMRLIHFFQENMDKFGHKKNKPLSMNKSLFREVHSIKIEDLAIEAFKMMSSKNIAGVAVVDNGKLVGSMELRDLKAIHTDGAMFWRLHEPISSFLEKMKRDFRVLEQVITLKEDDTLEKTINMMSNHKLHQIYIVDAEMKPIGVVSIKNILLDLITF